MELISEILLQSKLEDVKRLREILAELKSKLQMSFSASGNVVSAMRAMSYFSSTARYNDLTLDFYRVLSEYEECFDEKKEQLIQKLKDLSHRTFTKETLLAAVTCDEEGYKEADALQAFWEKLPSVKAIRPKAEITCIRKNEGFMDASKVQYVSRAGDFKRAGYSYTGALKILKVILSYDYLWLNVRVKGGAYGCGGGFTRDGNVYFSSYRDPNLQKTNEIYENIPEYIKTFTADERDMTKYIIGTVSDLDTPLSPFAKGMRAVSAYLMHLTQEDIQTERDEIISATQEDIRNLADLLSAVLSQENICVIGNEDKISSQKDMFEKIEPLF